MRVAPELRDNAHSKADRTNTEQIQHQFSQSHRILLRHTAALLRLLDGVPFVENSSLCRHTLSVSRRTIGELQCR